MARPHHLVPPATPHTVVASLVGGLIIGLTSALFYYLTGQRAGLSGMFNGE